MRKAFAGLLSVALYAHALAYDISKPSIADNDVRRKKAEYGTFTVPPRSEDNGMLRLKNEVDPPCSDCVITVMSANLEYPDGTTADAGNGMWMHHIVFLNKAHLDGTCGEKKPGQRFWGAGNERSPLDLTNGGKSKVGYYIGKNDKFQISVELMNMHYSSQDVVLTATWEYIEAPYSDYKLGTPYWLDIAGCDHSDRPAANDSRFAYSSPSFGVDFYGQIAYLGNHMHDGAVLQEVMKNGEIICSANPQYSAGEGADGKSHLSHIPFCSDAGYVAPGDEFSVTASYDTSKHAPMLNEDGSLEPIMGIALAYFVKGAAPTRNSGNGGFGVAIALAIVATVVLVAGVGYALYVGKQHKEWPKWFSRQQKYRSLGREESEFADE